MAGKQIPGDGLSANIAGMSKNQLYDIMCQMKTLIEQNQHQARQILIQNPLLTKALFQAQIMLGMVKPPQTVPNIQPQVSQNPQQTLQPAQQSNAQSAPMMLSHVGMLDSAGASEAQVPPRKQLQNQPSVTTSSPATPALSYQQLSVPTHSLQPPPQSLRPLNPPISSGSFPQSSQLPNLPAPPSHSQPLNQLQKPAASGQLPQSLQSGGFPHLPLQPPMPPQARPSATFHSQYPPKMGPNLGPQHGGVPHNLPQSVYHLGGRPPAGVGNTFPQGQPSIPNLPQTQMQYQGGTPHVGTEFSHQMGNPMQVDRNSSWMPSASEHSSIAGHPGQQSVGPGQIGAGNQPSRAPAISPEMEKQLLQQVMSLTPEQINLLPPEQRNQVLQLQQVLRQ